jgi:hypothetical protein
MNSIKMRKIFMAMLLAVFTAAAVCGAAFAAPVIVGLEDFATYQDVRPNTYDTDYGYSDIFELQIVKSVFDPSTGSYYPEFFSSAAEANPKNFTWTLVSTTSGDSYIDIGTGRVVQDGPTRWYYSVEAYGFGSAIGPESWEAVYNYGGLVTSGDFTFVGTEFRAPDTGSSPFINIEFYDMNPRIPADLVTSGKFKVVDGSDDYAWSPAHGRSYATALDAVAHSFYPAGIIRLYTKAPGFQLLDSITDLNGNVHPDPRSEITGWLYAVYYTDDGRNYVRDPDSFYIGPDDYKFKDDKIGEKTPALVIWGIGGLSQYGYYFPDTITR